MLLRLTQGMLETFSYHKKKAMFASKNNLEYVAERKAELAAASADEVSRAEAKATQLKDQSVEIKVPVTDEGALYGSVGTREISDAFAEKNLEVDKSYVQLPDGPIKEVGDHKINLLFHPEVSTEITVIVKPE